jgi:hypothetical protein
MAVCPSKDADCLPPCLFWWLLLAVTCSTGMSTSKLQVRLNLFCHLIEFDAFNLSEFAKTRHLLSLKPRHDMHVQVEDVLPRGSAVLFDDAYAVGFCGGFDCWGNMFGCDVDLAEQGVGNVEDVDVMLFWYDEGVPHVERANVEESHHCVVLVEDACWCLLTCYSAEYAGFLKAQAMPPPSRLDACSLYVMPLHIFLKIIVRLKFV